MPKLADHPSREELSAYSLGQLPEERAVAIDSHISECEPCCETIVALSSEDTFAGLLQEAGRLPTDQTADHEGATANSDSFDDIPQPLSEHPRYEILGLIGKGGMGDVYQARHRKMERTVALKVVNRGLVQKAEAIDRFHREVKAAAQLSHPNIVTSHDADHAGDFHFMVMEFVDGVDLSQTVKKRGALPVAEACDYIRQAAIGLQHAHQRGMVHRDIKPHNLMVTKDGTVKILDFGLASLAPEAIEDPDTVEAHSDLTAVGAIMGTPDFISPEQAKDARNADIRSDIYSLGATLYYLLSGRVPFDDGSVMHKLKSHAQVEPAPLNSVRDDLPEELVAIAAKMMAKDPDERYLTPSEVADALESFLRTYRPEGAGSHKHEPSSGGNMSVSGGPKTDADVMPPNRLSVWARWFFYLSLLPIAILFIDLFVLSDETSAAAADRLMWYVLVSIGLSSIAGVLTGVNQAQSSAAGDRRVYRLTTEQAVLIAAILIGAAAVYYVDTNNGVVRVEVNDPALTVSIQGETITMTDRDKQPLTIRPGEQTLVVRKVDAGLEFETDRFQIRRGDKIAFKVELLEGEIVVRKDGETFHSTTLPEKIDFSQQVFERMTKVYAECKSYTDTGVIEAVVRQTPNSPNVIIDHSFTTAFVRPGRLRFEIEDEDKEKLLISANDGNIQTWWDLEPGIRKPASLDLAFAQALGFAGGNVGHVPALLMPQELEFWEASLKVAELQRMYERKLENVECYCLDFKFDEQRTVLWIDKQSYLIRRIEQWINSEDLYAEWRTTFIPTINGNVTEQMLEFDPPGQRAADDRANGLAKKELKQLQGNWESVSVTESGKQLSIENGFAGLLLQIQGDTFAITEKKPNGEESKVDTGRIEIDSTTSPKNIDFIGRAQSTFGIYELKGDVLRVCLVEQGGTDAPAGERVPDTKPLKRPTTFDSPDGSNIMLMEFRRVPDNSR